MIEWAPNPPKTGVDRGVLYLAEGGAVPWPGLVEVTEQAADDTIQTDMYYDGVRFGLAQGSEDFKLSVTAWTYPSEFEIYDGTADLETKQPRQPFGFSYREGSKIHLVYNAIAEPSENVHSSKNNEFEISQFVWVFDTVPTSVTGAKPCAHIVLDTDLAPADAVSAVEDMIYGTPSSAPRLSSPDEIISVMQEYPVLIITDNGDGTWTATGPDAAIIMLDSETFKITWPSAIPTSPTTYKISSM